MIDRDRLVAGDPAYFEELVRDYGLMVKDICRGFARSEDEAEDSFQETWVRVWRRRASYDGGPFRTWLLVIARNICRDQLRRGGTYRGVIENARMFENPAPAPDPLQVTIAEERRRAVREVVAGLPRRQREAIEKRLNGDRSTREIAEDMCIDSASVRSLISKGLAKVGEELRRIE